MSPGEGRIWPNPQRSRVTSVALRQPRGWHVVAEAAAVRMRPVWQELHFAKRREGTWWPNRQLSPHAARVAFCWPREEQTVAETAMHAARAQGRADGGRIQNGPHARPDLQEWLIVIPWGKQMVAKPAAVRMRTEWQEWPL